MIDDLRPMHRSAIAAATELVERVTAAELDRPTPCEGWTLRDLIAHMVGQNHGFADAVTSEAVPLASFRAREPVDGAWRRSADRLVAAFAAASTERTVLLPEISRDARFPLLFVVSFQLLDTVVHAWDVARGLGVDWTPTPDVAGAVRRIADLVPDGPEHRLPGAAFGPPAPSGGSDPWPQALAKLGRDPRWPAGDAVPPAAEPAGGDVRR